MTGAGRVRVVVVVPAFAEGQERDPPVVASSRRASGSGASPTGASPSSPARCSAGRRSCGRRCPRARTGMPPNASRARPTTTFGDPVPVGQPRRGTGRGEVGRVARQHRGVVVQPLAGEDPAHVRPAGAFARRVRIAFVVGVLMMDAVRGDPEDRSALERQRAAEGQEVLDPLVASCSRGASAGGDSAMPMPSMPRDDVEHEGGEQWRP